MKTEQFKELAGSLLREDKLLKSRITPRKLQEAYESGLAECKISDGKIIAFGALWPTRDKKWHELGTMWVHPDWRNKNIAGKLFKDCIKKHKDTNFFLITRSKKILHLANKYGMQEAENWHTNPFWIKVCEPWDSLPKKSTRILPKEGRLFYISA